jgi:hypothetical protein
MLPAQHPSANSSKMSAFTMEAAGSSETSINIYHTPQRQFPANSNVTYAVTPVLCLDVQKLAGGGSIGKINLMTFVFPKDTRVSFTQNAMESFQRQQFAAVYVTGKNNASDKFIQLQNAQK